MKRPNPSQETTFGYLSTLELPDHGFFGGYLIISPLGRPLEFHCTAPVRPSRAQQILYGPTLQPYLLGEQIGGTLLGKAELVPKVVLTDQAAVLSLRGQTRMPLVLLAEVDRAENSAAAGESAANASMSLGGGRFAHLGYDWELPPSFETDHAAVVALLEQLAKHVDLAEPFDRIHEAIREAQRIGTQGPDAHANAA